MHDGRERFKTNARLLNFYQGFLNVFFFLYVCFVQLQPLSTPISILLSTALVASVEESKTRSGSNESTQLEPQQKESQTNPGLL